MINAYTTETVTLKRGRGIDEWGEPDDTINENIKAYIDWTNRLVRDEKGEQAVSAVRVLLAYDGTIDYEDKITINSVDHSIIKIGRMQDFSATHIEVFLA